MTISSLALWYIPKDAKNKDNPTDAEAHFNLWKLPIRLRFLNFKIKRPFSRYLDIGLRLKNAKHIQAIQLFVPSRVELKDLKDLGGYLRDPDLLCAVFNDDLDVKIGKLDYYKVYKNKKLDFKIYRLDTSKFNLDYNFDPSGTLITIELDYQGSRDLYIRFRVLGEYPQKLSFIDKPPNAIFQSAFYRTDTIDFRLNEMRVLPNKFIENMKSNGKVFAFSKIHFFFICTSKEEWFFSQLPYANCRILESNKWNSYAEGTAVTKNACTPPESKVPILAYHWKSATKDDQLISDFNILIKTKFEQNVFRTIGIFLVVGLLLSLITEVLGSKVNDCLFPPPKKEQQIAPSRNASTKLPAHTVTIDTAI